MKPEIQSELGKALYEEAVRHDAGVEWQHLSTETQKRYGRIAEAVVKKLAAMLVPAVVGTLLEPEDIERLLTQQPV